jgi:hypothetical protein
LEESFFFFNDKFFKQKVGVPIGSKCGCSLACLYLIYFEERFFATHPCDCLLSFWRYIDDIFGTWKGSNEEFLSFFEKINSFDPCIKFTCTGLQDSLSVLDVLISVGDEGLSTNLFTKPTDKKLLLNFKSNHPPHIKKALPFMMARRVVLICSKREDVEKELSLLADIFFRRGYPSSIIKSGFLKALKLDRNQILSRSPTNEPSADKNFFLTTTFLSDINWQRIKKDTNILKNRSGIKNRVCFGFRNGRNLNSFLVSSKLNDSVVDKSNFRRISCCQRANCPIFKYQKDF